MSFVKFVVRHENISTVSEVGFGGIATFANKAPADRYLNHLNDEHRNGRVAQATCSNGVACDRPRIHDVAPFLIWGRGREVVLCPEHQKEVIAVAEALKRARP